MNEREKLMKRLQVCDFVLQETGLFLDTHPTNQEALAYFKKYQQLRKEANDAYVEKYGPVSRSDFKDGPRWTWVDEPWPWEEGK